MTNKDAWGFVLHHLVAKKVELSSLLQRQLGVAELDLEKVVSWPNRVATECFH